VKKLIKKEKNNNKNYGQFGKSSRLIPLASNQVIGA
jgi:hypothetical protein